MVVAGQAEFLERETQPVARHRAKRAIRRSLLQRMFMPVIDFDEPGRIDLIPILRAQDFRDGRLAFVPLDQRAVAIEA